MSNPHVTRKYDGYAMEVADDTNMDVWYEGDGPDVLKVHFRVARVPSRKTFVIRHFAASTAADRREAEALMPRIPAIFESCERHGIAFKRRAPEGYFFWVIYAGHIVDDPFAQLELEMMIDNSLDRDRVL